MFDDILLLLHCVVTRHHDDFSDAFGKFFHLRRTMRRLSAFDILYGTVNQYIIIHSNNMRLSLYFSSLVFFSVRKRGFKFQYNMGTFLRYTSHANNLSDNFFD